MDFEFVKLFFKTQRKNYTYTVTKTALGQKMADFYLVLT